MKAVLCRQYGGPELLTYEELPSLEPGKGEVVIEVHACSVNFPDTLIIQNKYQYKPPLPFSPGGEVAGVVKRVGDGVVDVKPGDRVIGLTSWGGFAEETLAEAHRVIRLPPGIAMDRASALILTYGTSYYALKDRAQLAPGETVLVLGAAGGTGLAAVELAKLMGARVIACASDATKLQACKDKGADELINYATEDLRQRVRDLTGDKGVDVVYDPVGGAYAEPALRSMAWRGRYLVIGFSAGDIPRLPWNLVLLKGCSIVGVFYGALINHEPERFGRQASELVEWLRDGKITPAITSKYALKDAAKAMDELAGRRAIGKVVLMTDAGSRQAQ